MEPSQNIPETTAHQSVEPKSNAIRLEFKKQHLLALSFGVALALILGTLFYSKGVFIAATVNGSPISRLSVITELEKQGGKQALESLISERLIKAELKKSNIVVSDADVDTEIKKIEEQVASQGGTLEEALTAQGMSMDILRTQIATQKGLEVLLADKVKVSDEELATALKSAEGSAPEGMTTDELKTAITEQLKQQKFQEEAQKWIADITAGADIKYFVTY
jgi:parvulin-like peptidyl-prolyl isomerase